MRKHVLLVDDDEINRLVATKFLKKWDIDVTLAFNGLEAIREIQSKKFQLVLMDLHMPELDGYECTRKIRGLEDPYFKTVPIIAFSASAYMESKQRAMEFGMTDCMSKPFRAEELLEKIRPYIGDAMPAQAALRPLYIDFALHTDGDPAFKVELTELLTGNLSELSKALRQAIDTHSSQVFSAAAHKVSTALAILNDAEFTLTVDKLKKMFKEQANLTDRSFLEAVESFERLSYSLLKSLETHLELFRKGSDSTS